MDTLPGWVTKAKSGTASFGAVTPGAAANYLPACPRRQQAVACFCWIIAAIVRIAWIGFICCSGPFAGVAVHIIKAPGIWLVAAYVCRCYSTVVKTYIANDVSARDSRLQDAFAKVGYNV